MRGLGFVRTCTNEKLNKVKEIGTEVDGKVFFFFDSIESEFRYEHLDETTDTTVCMWCCIY